MTFSQQLNYLQHFCCKDGAKSLIDFVFCIFHPQIPLHVAPPLCTAPSIERAALSGSLDFRLGGALH
ncbi:hypothetical protein JTE90_024303 [Oedothorax gibbosus]|uniref:Uncharacterized protein n=1 Tax=Oedothorax gibbosus TaxID=931172 RepID=A0AAV6VY85_9ARAC|nr:hypothetical protein JTE90_024303 [Oedothorax gibbosus]